MNPLFRGLLHTYTHVINIPRCPLFVTVLCGNALCAESLTKILEC